MIQVLSNRLYIIVLVVQCPRFPESCRLEENNGSFETSERPR